jgi:5'-nucleotidase
MSRQILITNDDGIEADGIRKLAEIAREFGEVTVIAPDTQRSAASHHCIFNRPLILKEYDFGLDGVKAFTLDGTPADCVRVGIFAVSDSKPDIVLSGINHGYNISSDIQYSGTVGAALEAAFLGIRGVAVSYGNHEFKATDIVDRYLPELLAEYMEKPLLSHQIWNINFPDCRADECRGICRDAVMNTENFYDDQYMKEPAGDKAWAVTNIARRVWKGSEGSDLDAVINRFIAVGTVTNLT